MLMSITQKTARALCALALVAGAHTVAPKPASAQDVLIGQVVPVAFTFCPRSFAAAAGQLLPIAQNTALFSLYGTTYGGDGRTTMGLPDLRGAAPIHEGRGPGLSDWRIGARGGAETVTLTVAQMPNHNHTFLGSNGTADTVTTNNTVPATVSDPNGLPINLYSSTPPNVDMAPDMIRAAGGGQAHENRPPFLAINWCVALQGVYPSRS